MPFTVNWKIKNEHNYLKIELIILLFILVRLIGIVNPPLEIAHSWRQVTGLMVSRNFLEVDPSIWFPRVDENHGLSGIIGMEFPLLNYLHYFISLLFDYDHWYGRLINLLVSSCGIYFFYRLIKETINWKTAYYAGILLLGSIWFSYSRKMMPDTFSMSLAIIGLYFAHRYSLEGKTSSYALFFLFICLGFLSKISAVFCLVAIPFIVDFTKAGKVRTRVSAGVIIALVISYIWYFQWNTHLSENYGNWYNSGSDMPSGFNALFMNPWDVLKQFYFSSFKSYLAFALFLVSLTVLFVKKERNMLLFLGASILFFLLYMAKSGSIFIDHEYYIIPIVPVFSIMIGYFLASLKQHMIVVPLLVLCLIESISNQQHDLFTKESEKYKLTLENICDQHFTKSTLIGINGNGNPQELYLSHRKGWVLQNEQCIDPVYIEKIKRLGCEYLIVNVHSLTTELPYLKTFENEHYRIYRIVD